MTAKHRGQVSWLKALPNNSKAHHSGATARDSHPFPYSPHFLGHPDTFKYKELFVIEADTITRLETLSNQRLVTPKPGFYG